MRQARRLIATLVGVAFWCVAATEVAYARPLPDPLGDVAPPQPVTSDPGTPAWKIALIVALAALVTVAVVGLIASLRHARPSQKSRVLHA
jgi:hypothetical protein